jgi:hypothetical protein
VSRSTLLDGDCRSYGAKSPIRLAQKGPKSSELVLSDKKDPDKYDHGEQKIQASNDQRKDQILVDSQAREVNKNSTLSVYLARFLEFMYEMKIQYTQIRI